MTISKMSMNHISLRVKNLQESFRFYHEILGLPVVRIIGPLENPRLIFLEGLELSQLKPDQESVDPDQTGFYGHIGFEVQDIEQWIKKLEEQGVQFTLKFRDVIFKEEKHAVKVSFFTDPDNIPLELVEWRKLP